jgi:hypothetical protein
MFERVFIVSPVVYIVNNFYEEIKLTSNSWTKVSFKSSFLFLKEV